MVCHFIIILMCEYLSKYFSSGRNYSCHSCVRVCVLTLDVAITCCVSLACQGAELSELELLEGLVQERRLVGQEVSQVVG